MSGPLADIVAQIHQLSDSTANLRTLLNRLQQREDQLIQMLPELDDVANALVPATHTLGLIFILSCKAAAVPLSQPQAARTFCEQCRRVLDGCDPQQVQLVPAQCAHLPIAASLFLSLPRARSLATCFARTVSLPLASHHTQSMTDSA